jgi:hypothetical protein
MKALVDRRAILVAPFVALALFPTTAFADAICLFSTCPGAPLSSPFPGTIPVPEGLNSVFLALPVVPGDTVLNDDPGFTIVGDVLRFLPGGPINLYSDNPGTDPPDTGIPLLGTNVFSMFEGPATPIIYTAGAPGTQNTYAIFSDFDVAPDIPEPSTVMLVGAGVIALVLGLRRKSEADPL